MTAPRRTTTPATPPTTTPPTRAAGTPTRPTPEQLSTLARFVADTGEFLARHFSHEPLLRRTGASFDDLLSLADVDAQLAGAGLRRPVVRLVRDGEVVDPSRWTRRARTGRTHLDDLVDPARVLALFDAGATVVLQSLHRWWPALTAACRDLETALGHPTQANAYLTPPGAAGLTPHHDTHDVFILQVHGTKHWVVRSPVVEAPLERHRSDHAEAAARPVVFEADLGPGDVLYLPRGYVHSAAAQEGASLHLTIGVLATTVHDLLRRLVDLAAGEAAFRRTVPVGFGTDPAVAARAVKDAAAELVRWLDDLDTDGAGLDAVERAARRRPPLLGGHLLQLVGVDAVDDGSVVRRRPGVACRVEDAGRDRVAVDLADRRILMPAAVRPALDLVLDGGVHAVGELAGTLDRQGRLVLVRRLVREAALEVVHGP